MFRTVEKLEFVKTLVELSLGESSTKAPSKNLKQAVPVSLDGHRLFKVLGEGF